MSSKDISFNSVSSDLTSLDSSGLLPLDSLIMSNVFEVADLTSSTNSSCVDNSYGLLLVYDFSVSSFDFRSFAIGDASSYILTAGSG